MMFYRNVQEKYRENSIRKAIEAGQITDDDARLIRSYVAEYQAVRHVKEHRVQKTLFDLIQWRRFIRCEYRSATI